MASLTRNCVQGCKDSTRSLIQGKKRQNAGIPVGTDRKVKMLQLDRKQLGGFGMSREKQYSAVASCFAGFQSRQVDRAAFLTWQICQPHYFACRSPAPIILECPFRGASLALLS